MNDDLFSSVFASVTGAASAVPAALLPWMHALATQGAVKIGVRLAAQDPCCDPTCTTRQYGAVRCLKCQRVACLHHAFLGPTGDGVCLACAGITIKAAPQKDHHAVLAAFSFLGLDTTATEAVAKKHVQQLLAKAHPDKHGKDGSAKHAEATKAFKGIGSAFDVIKKARGWA